MQWVLTNAFLIFFLGISGAQAQTLSFSRNARTFETQHSSLVTKSLAHSCLTIIDIPDGLPCNPSMTALNKKPLFGVELLLSNGYASLESVRKLLDGKITQEMVDTMFSQGKVIQIEANADVNFKSKYLNAQYTPITVKGFSVVRNEANPDVELYAIEEKGFTFQSGLEVFNDFYAGVQARFINRKFISQRFKLVQLGTQVGKDLIKPKEQIATYIEPGATYFLAKTWRPRVSVFVANLGYVSKQYEELKTPVEAQYGLGFSPPVGWGDLDISIEYRSMNYEESDIEKLRLGALYHFGSMYLSGGIDGNGISGGVYYGLDKFNAGIVYSTTRFVDEESFFAQTVYVQLGWQI
ncbi:MAG: hypothetical protein SGI74_14420 [Oligoflexia bacterium]|nr:hypothetical protein [Oligoflexia bacterium]